MLHRESKDHDFSEFHRDYIALLNRAFLEHASALPVISDSPYMPPAATARFMELMREARCYLEYGTGGTTISARRAGLKTLVAVESDPQWLEAVRRKLDEGGGTEGCGISCMLTSDRQEIGAIQRRMRIGDATQTTHSTYGVSAESLALHQT